VNDAHYRRFCVQKKLCTYSGQGQEPLGAGEGRCVDGLGEYRPDGSDCSLSVKKIVSILMGLWCCGFDCSDCSLSVKEIISRIQKNQEQFVSKFAKKKKAEDEYYDERYKLPKELQQAA
jgi:hypothetical protein